MKNEERADRLLSEAESIFNELEQSLESENWNLTIRRAQEVVELVMIPCGKPQGIINHITTLLHRGNPVASHREFSS